MQGQSQGGSTHQNFVFSSQPSYFLIFQNIQNWLDLHIQFSKAVLHVKTSHEMSELNQKKKNIIFALEPQAIRNLDN